MDLQLYIRVLWRFRLLVLAGVVLASTLAFLSFARLSFEGGAHLIYREQEQWSSRATLLVTENEFPWGRAVFEQEIFPVKPDERKVITPNFAPSGRFTELANLYAQLATGDAVRAIMLRDGPLKGVVEATPLIATNGTDAPLPVISIAGISTTPERAAILAKRATDAFREFLDREQDRSGIPADERVLIEVIRLPNQVELLSGRSKTMPIVVFLTVMLAVVGLAFVLENLRPRIRPVANEAEGVEQPRVRARRPA